MDTSKEYIDMCQGATEIHHFRPNRLFHLANPVLDTSIFVEDLLKGEFINHGESRDSFPKEDLDNSQEYERKSVMAVWLPQQDQLQEMLWKCKTIPKIQIDVDEKPTISAILDNTIKLVVIGESFEKLWLKIYMRVVHNKWWIDEKREWNRVSGLGKIFVQN